MFPVTINMNASFLGATRRGSIFGEARVLQLGRAIAFLDVQLADEDKKLVACATASVRLVKHGFANESQS
jgi:acyl-coenzyme A thioesterase PaaI-like protein